MLSAGLDEARREGMRVRETRILTALGDNAVRTGDLEAALKWLTTAAEVPAKWEHFIALNAERVAVLKNAGVGGVASGLGNITQKQPPLLGTGCKKS